MERLVIDKSKCISADKVSFFDGIIAVYSNDTLIGSVVPITQDEKKVRMVTIFEDSLFDSLEDTIDAFFDYEFKYITE
jgi:ribosome recycling factor